MSAATVENPLSVTDSKTQRKKKSKTDGAVNGANSLTPATPAKPDSEQPSSDGTYESPYIRELMKHIRGVNKKLNGMQKADAVVAENPGVDVDELVKQKKLNQDQKAQILKKPQLQAQVAQLEEQITQYRKVDNDYQGQLKKQKEDIEAGHKNELEKVREDAERKAMHQSTSEVRKKLLIFSQFLRAAAAKRNQEEEADTDESRAFEGALLLVYGGDSKAVDTAIALIDGSDEQVPSIDGVALSTTFSQIRQASIDHAPFQAEEQWIDSVASANAANAPVDPASAQPGSDPTLVNAGLTEVDTASAQVNGATPEGHESQATPAQASAGDDSGNQAGERWDTTAPGAEKSMEDSFEMIPRPADEVDNPTGVSTTQGEQKMSWADDVAPAEPPSGNAASESWDPKPAGDAAAEGTWTGSDANTVPTGTTDPANDGFSEVPGRHRGRGGQRGRGGDGEFRGRGRGRGGFRGDGEARGRGRGGFRGGRGDGEFRGGRGRGRGGPRGGGGQAAAPTSTGGS